MHRFVRRPYKLATLALLSSRVHVLPFSPSRRFPSCVTGTRVSKMSMASAASQKDDIVVSSEDLLVFHLKRTVDSTQEEAKRLLDEHRSNECRILAVIADDQRKGRGTGGRSWVASSGNLFLTCAISMDLIPLKKVTLLPLGVGVLVAERLAEHAKTTRPAVKWPNDVLLGGLKIAGILIENYRVGQQDWWLVGIGVNIDSHPLQLPPEKGGFHAKPRSATCLRDHAKGAEIPTALELGIDLTSGLQQLTRKLQTDQASLVISAWKSWAQMGASYTIRETGEKVITVNIEDDGQLRVIGRDGQERLLVADYFY